MIPALTVYLASGEKTVITEIVVSAGCLCDVYYFLLTIRTNIFSKVITLNHSLAIGRMMCTPENELFILWSHVQDVEYTKRQQKETVEATKEMRRNGNWWVPKS